MQSLPPPGLYAITDCDHLDTARLVYKTEQILAAGAVMLQYRNKKGDPSTMKSEATALQDLCNRYSIPFIINDDIELARAINADGVHLGKDDISCKEARDILGPEKIIGLSCYNDLRRALNAESSGADYIAFGAFFPTTSKSEAVKAELPLLHEARKKINVPIVAIGGITPENGKDLIEAGANYLAVISGVYAQEDSASVARAYVKLFKSN